MLLKLTDLKLLLVTLDWEISLSCILLAPGYFAEQIWFIKNFLLTDTLHVYGVELLDVR